MAKFSGAMFIQDPTGYVFEETAVLVKSNAREPHMAEAEARRQVQWKFAMIWLNRLTTLDWYLANQVWEAFRKEGWKMVLVEFGKGEEPPA